MPSGLPSGDAGLESPTHRVEARDSPVAHPVFGALRGGYRVLLDALADAARADLRLGTTVRAIEPSAAGWLLVLGPTTAPEALEVDAVVLAVPAPAVARLLQPVAPAAAAAAAGIELASSVVVALAFREERRPRSPPRRARSWPRVEPLSAKGTHPLVHEMGPPRRRRARPAARLAGTVR